MESGVREKGYVCMYGWVPSLFTGNCHNFVSYTLTQTLKFLVISTCFLELGRLRVCVLKKKSYKKMERSSVRAKPLRWDSLASWTHFWVCSSMQGEGPRDCAGESFQSENRACQRAQVTRGLFVMIAALQGVICPERTHPRSLFIFFFCHI